MPIAPVATTSVKGKNTAKESSVSLRVVPPRVGSKWGVPMMEHDDSQIVGTDKVAWVAPSTLARIRRRLGQAQDASPLFVSLRREEEKKEDVDDKEEAAAPQEGEEEEEPPLEAWLTAWEEMPTGCLLLTGEVAPEWASWVNAT
jgi:peroxin-1